MSISEKIKRLAKGKQDIQAIATGLPEIAPMASRKQAEFPLTDIQQAYWVGRQAGFSMGNVAAHGYLEVDADNLDLARLEQCFNLLIQRHDMLRAIVTDQGTQKILPDVPHYTIKHQDLKNRPASENALEQWRDEMSHQCLNPANWPLFDIRASSINAQTTRLHISLDVLIVDAMSIDLLSDELHALYRGESLQEPLVFSFADYVAGLEALKQTDLYNDSQEYWRKKISSLPAAPELPLAMSPEKISRPEFRRRCHRLPENLWQAFKSQAQALGITPSVAVLAAYTQILAQWSQQQRFCLNLTLFNRIPFHQDVEKLVGDFTSVILLDVNCRPDTSFATHAQQLLEQLWLDMDHRNVSGVWVLRELTEQRGRNSQMPVVFTSVMHPSKDYEAKSAFSWLGDIHYTVTQTPQVWLDHQISEDKGDLIIDWDAVEELFPAGLLDDMFSSFLTLLEQLCKNPEAWKTRWDDLRPQQQRALIDAVNDTTQPIPTGLLHESIVRQIVERPTATALVDEFGGMDFATLGKAANRVAHALIKKGIKQGDLVSVLLPKSRHQIISVLGILQAGAVYLPIESDYACERIARINELAGSTCTLTLANLIEQKRLPVEQAIALDQLDQTLPDTTPVLQAVKPTDLAYIIYTSGSTGTPKGVVIDHRGALNTCVDINQRFNITADDRVLALSAMNFDLSVYDIFGVMGQGGCLVLPHAANRHEPRHWHQLMTEHNVSVWNTVPALMEIYASYLRDLVGTPNTQVRTVMMSGDWIPLSLPGLIKSTCPNAQVYSLGGATEVSIWSIYHPIGEIQSDWKSVPYGKPLANQYFRILNNQLAPCPLWVTGDLYIGGIGLAQGYWKDAEKTAASFIVHPTTGERLYKTGDLGRYLPDGNIEFLGRKDFQVKINGFRVELGEIETAMTQFPGITQAVVAVSDAGQRKNLVGYYVHQDADKGTTDSAKLLERLNQPGLRQDLAKKPGVSLLAVNRDVLQRKSQRHFGSTPLTRNALSQWLGSLSADMSSGFARYPYASAGGLYPVQTYLYVKAGKVEGLEEGLYYYHPVQHSLLLVDSNVRISGELFAAVNQAIYASASVALFMVANLDVLESHYGENATPLVILEAGAMSHLLEERAAYEKLGACQIGGFAFEHVRDAFNLNFKHQYLHCLLMGPMPENKTTTGFDKTRFEAELRQYLGKHLPDYMVPRHLMALAELPLSANGKVDRKALPGVQTQTSIASKTKQSLSPWTPIIADAWKDVLKQEHIQTGNTFFELGGTSVEMIKVHTRLQGKLPVDISLIDMFFTYPTINDLTAHLDELATTSTEAGDNNQPERRRSLSSQRQARQSNRAND